MPFEVKMPQLGLTMETGTVVNWLVGVGEHFTSGQEILEVETDKATVAVEAHHEGRLARVLVPAGQEAAVGTTLAVAVSPGESLSPDWGLPRAGTGAVAADIMPAGMQWMQTSGRSDAGDDRSRASARWPRPGALQPGVVRASWKARAMAHEAGVDLRTLAGSGAGGRVVAVDVTRALAAPSGVAPVPPVASPVAAQLAAALGLDLSRIVGSGPQGRIVQADVISAASALIQGRVAPGATPVSRPARVATGISGVIPLTGVRGTVSERMAASAHTTARVTLFREVDATAMIDLRARFSAQGTPVAYNDILTRVCATALRDYPEANARMGDGHIEQLDCIHIGVAVDTDRGLLVPVVHHADTLSIPQIAAESARLIEAARSGRCLPDDLSGGTFTITNLGMLGVEGFTPVINLPECCILGVGRIVRKPVVIESLSHPDAGTDEAEGGHPSDALGVRPMMMLSLACDHRVIDGAPAARFLEHVAQLLRDPLLLL